MSRRGFGYSHRVLGRTARWLAVGVLVLSQVALVLLGPAPAPARAEWIQGVTASAHHALDGYNYTNQELPLYSEEWNDYVSGAHGVVSLSHQIHGSRPPYFEACMDAPYGCNSASILVEANEAAGTLRLASSNSNWGLVLEGDDEIGNRSVLNRTPQARLQIDDAITLSAPATITLKGHLKGSVLASWFDYPECGSEVSFGTTLGFYHFDATNRQVWDGMYNKEIKNKESIDEDLSVEVSLPAGTTYFQAAMRSSAYAYASASNYPQNDPPYIDHCSESIKVRFGNTLGYEVEIPDGVTATSASGLLPIRVVGAPDVTPPDTAADLISAPNAAGWVFAEPNAAGWVAQDVTVSLMATDNPTGSGVKEVTYSATGAQTIPSTTVPGDSADIPVTAEGETTIAYFATDNAGNVEATKTLVVRLDETAPTGAVLINDGVESTNTASVTLGLTGDDGAGSGVTHMRFADTSAGLSAIPWVAFADSSPYALAGADGTKTVYAQFRDAAGNFSIVCWDDIVLNTTQVDTTKPTISAAISGGTQGDNGWYTSDVTVHFTCADNDGGSGIPDGACPVDEVLSDEGPAISSTAQTVTDAAGNVSDPSNVVVVEIDKTVPAGTISINDGAASTDTPDVTLGLTGDDGAVGSGVIQMRFADTSEGLNSAAWMAFAASSPYTLAGVEGTQPVYAQFRDAAGNVSGVYSDEIVVSATLDTTAPTITVSPVDLAVVPVGTAITFSAQDDESGLAPDSPAGSLDDGATTTTVPSGYQPPAGVYALVVTASDVAGNVASQTVRFTVYDPAGGFVTGAGFIDSPVGAYVADPSLAGRAFFGFVSKYLKGATVPTGRTAFEFKVANLDFHGTSFQWLVVNKAGNNAQFKGTGLINGQQAQDGQDFTFLIWATSSSPDTFRIKIWWEETSDSTVIEHVVYDNGAEQAIGGGSIMVHAK